MSLPRIVDTPCRHDWLPILGWGGRYRCSDCMAIGYRGVVSDHLAGEASLDPHETSGGRPTAHAASLAAQIIPYACQTPKCGRRATHSRKGKRACWECAERKGWA